MKRNAGKRNAGFSLVELIISAAILAIMVGLSASCMLKTYRSAKEDKYKLETVSILRAVQMYILDRGGESKELCDTLMEELSMYSVAHRKNVLQPYLTGKVTRNTWIYYIQFQNDKLISIGYLIDGYVIIAEVSGKVYIEIYPGPDSPNAGDGP